MEKAIYWIVQNKGKIIAAVAISIILLFLINFFSKNAVIFVSVSTSPTNNANAVIVYATSNRPNQKLGNPGLLIVPRDTTSVIATQGDNIKTESKIIIPWYGILSANIALQPDKNATKVAFRSTTGSQCATYNQSADKLAYYQCSNPKTLTTYETPTNSNWHNKKIADLYFPSKKASPYLGGLIGLSHTNDTDSGSPGDITVVSSSGKVSSYDSPDDADMATFNLGQIFTNTGDPSDKKFVISTVTGDLFIGNPTSGKAVAYKHISAPSDYNTDYNQTLCSIVSDVVYCYRGPTARGETPQNFDFSKVTGSQIFSYSFADETEKTIDVVTDLYALGDFQATTDGRFYATYYKQLFRFDKAGESYNPVPISENTGAIAAGDQLYFIQNKGVFVVDKDNPSVSRQVFYSPNIIPNSLYITSGKVFIIGHSPSKDSVTYAYLLGSDSNTSPGKRLIDLLPARIASAPTNDLVGDRIYTAITVPYKRNSSIKFDPGDIAEAKSRATESLRLLGIATDQHTLQFSY